MSPAYDGPKLVPPCGPKDHSLGPANAPATLVEFGDYQCPHCGRAQPVVAEVLLTAGKRLRFVFRHFPLAQIHPFAQPAAEAAEAAASQGKFWEMHEMLFENQDALEPENLAAYAEELGLDVPRFVRELETHVHTAKVREFFVSGVRSGVNGTPTFFVNGDRHDGPVDAESLLAALETYAE